MLVVALVIGLGATLVSPGAGADLNDPPQSLDGTGNNQAKPNQGAAGQAYTRIAAARYADGRSQPVSGPNSRFISNRIFNDAHQNIFSEVDSSQLVWVWGQFIDHTIGLRQGGTEVRNIPFNGGSTDPIETFTNTLGVIPFTRSAAAAGTGVSNARQQVNTQSSYIDAEAVYGTTRARLDWLRNGSQDGNPDNNAASLLVDGGAFLPRRDERGNAAAAPVMDADGRLAATPNKAAVAGDVRANENIGLTAMQTLFVREHNRIVNVLPFTLSQDLKFRIARRVVIAEQQFITYNEFLPQVGVALPSYQGYNPNVDASITNEFATTGYRAHSMIHGEMELTAPAANYSQATLDQIEAFGVEVEDLGDGNVEFVVPLNVAFFNPDLVELIGVGPILAGLSEERQYRNDEQIDNSLRSILFQIPVAGNPECLDGPTMPECFQGVNDLGAIDVERGRDHGIPSYNQLRQALGLPARTSFTGITGEATESFPSDPLLTPGNEINDPNSLDFVLLKDRDGNVIQPGTEEADEDVVTAVRRTTTAARLKAVFGGNVNNVDAFTGMVSEKHVTGSDLGELQRALWTKQFRALRDGDRFFFGNDGNLIIIRLTFGIDFRKTLGDVIALNTQVRRGDLEANVFEAPVG
jgi:Animal haem peroxidase